MRWVSGTPSAIRSCERVDVSTATHVDSGSYSLTKSQLHTRGEYGYFPEDVVNQERRSSNRCEWICNFYTVLNIFLVSRENSDIKRRIFSESFMLS